MRPWRLRRRPAAASLAAVSGAIHTYAARGHSDTNAGRADGTVRCGPAVDVRSRCAFGDYSDARPGNGRAQGRSADAAGCRRPL